MKEGATITSSHNVVIDHGTCTTKAGFSTEDTPQCNIPSLVGRGRHKGAMASLGLQETYVGSQAQALRGILALSSPWRQGAVQDWDDLEAVWDHCYTRELGVAPSDLPALLTLPPLISQKEENTMAEILVEKLGLPALYLANKSVMALYGGGQMTGVAVDSGQDTTYIVPAHQGKAIQDATLVLKVGGKQVTEHLMSQLINGKYSFPDDNFLLWRKKKKSKFTVSSKVEIIREMKEQYCYIAPDFATSLADPAFEEESVRLPDGNMIVMGQQKFTAPEIIFQPELASKKTCGLGELLYYSLMKCDEKLRAELAANITLSGGNTKFPGFDKRLSTELSNLLPEGQQPRVRALPSRELLSWVGGARLSNLSSFQRFWVTRADYQEKGVMRASSLTSLQINGNSEAAVA